MPLVENHWLKQSDPLGKRWLSLSQSCGLYAGGTDLNKSKAFLGKRKKEVGNVLIFMDFTVWAEGVERQSKPKLQCCGIRPPGGLCPGCAGAQSLLFTSNQGFKGSFLKEAML